MRGLGQVSSTRSFGLQSPPHKPVRVMHLGSSRELILILPPTCLSFSKSVNTVSIKTHTTEMLNIQINKWDNKNYFKIIFK